MREVRSALDLLKLHLRLKAYNPDQPRVPAGSGRISGQWMGQNVGFPSLRAPASDTPKPVRVAQSRPSRFSGRTIQMPRINGQTLNLGLAEEIQYEYALTARDSAVNSARQLDPNYRPPVGIYGSFQGLMNHLDAQRDDAELFVMNTYRAMNGDRALTLQQLQSPNSPSIRNTPTEELFAPRGNIVGYRFGQAKDNIRTVDPATFDSLVRQSTYGARAQPIIPSYNGIWYERGDACVVGLRISPKSGPTIDLIRNTPSGSILPKDFKVHVQ